MNNVNVQVTFPFQSEEETAKKVWAIHFNNTCDAILAAKGDGVMLESIRQDLIWARWQVDNLLGEAYLKARAEKAA